jgi:predicted site-specific integrase-resolvase
MRSMDSKEAELTSKILDRKVRLLTISEVAGLTKFSYRTIWNYVKTGYLKSVIISDKHIRIPSTEYQKLISNRK